LTLAAKLRKKRMVGTKRVPTTPKRVRKTKGKKRRKEPGPINPERSLEEKKHGPQRMRPFEGFLPRNEKNAGKAGRTAGDVEEADIKRSNASPSIQKKEPSYPLPHGTWVP